MLIAKKNLKDSANDRYMAIKDTAIYMQYTKTNKLITALYMVTDIIDKDEPLRNKLRTLGTEIISDMHSMPANACTRINQLMSFLDIASAINIISEMNCNILRKEFSELNRSIMDESGKVEIPSGQVNLSGFFTNKTLGAPASMRQKNYKGHTRIGVQKGSTLMQALSDKNLSDIGRPTSENHTQDFGMLKKERRHNIITIIKNNGGSATIKDIKNKMDIETNGDISFSEKTLQRELMSMTKDGVLNKTGEKRWTQYFIK